VTEKRIMDVNDELLERLSDLKRVLLDHVQHGNADEAKYIALRRDVLGNTRIYPLLPEFLKQDTTLLELRRRAQQLGGWVPRRTFIAEAFQPAFDYLQQPTLSPIEEVLTATLVIVDSVLIHSAWQKAIDRRKHDPDGAITIARTLVEAVCKHILGAGAYDVSWDLPKLYKETARRLRLDANQHADESLKQMLRGCTSAVEGLAAVRNKLGDAHGKGAGDPIPDFLQAELAVNLSGAMATFLISAWEESLSQNAATDVSTGEES
jgi:hypothetical protein